jgi:hypothetical protein
MAAWEGELDRDRLRLALDGRLPPAERQLPPVVVPALNRATVSNRG